jgi:putative zinc finger/helix-turn-helix YgiT family protein
MKCQICNCEESIVKEYNKIFNVKGKQIEEKIKSRFCKNCNNLIYDEKLDNEVSKKVIKKYLKEYGVEPQKIINLRKKYNLSQQLFSKIIGCAKKTLISYEKGNSIPNDIYLIVLKTLIENEDTIKSIIEANKENFDEAEYKKIEKNIYPYIGNNLKIIVFEGDNELNEYNGFTKLSFNKLKNIIIYLTKNGLHKTKLLKELFYIDFKCYKEFGYSMTGLEYARINYGPVPDNFEYVISKLIDDNIVDLEVIIHDNYEENIFKSLQKENMSEFNKIELKLINDVNNYFKDFTVSDIVDFSHKEKGYINTKPKEMISYEYSFDLNI